MSCDISNIMQQFNDLIDISIKGKAESITRLENGDFQVVWGDQYMVKTKPQAVNMARKKIDNTNTSLDEEGFSLVFGPYLELDDTGETSILIKRMNPERLIKALEIRNRAEDQGTTVMGTLTPEEVEYLRFEQQVREIETQEVVPTSELVLEAVDYTEDIKNGIFREQFRAQPEEFLKFIAEQSYGIVGREISNSAEQQAMEYFGERLVNLSKRVYPITTFVSSDNLPPIIPEC
jgi:hypothetical protein